MEHRTTRKHIYHSAPHRTTPNRPPPPRARLRYAATTGLAGLRQKAASASARLRNKLRRDRDSDTGREVNWVRPNGPETLIHLAGSDCILRIQVAMWRNRERGGYLSTARLASYDSKVSHRKHSLLFTRLNIKPSHTRTPTDTHGHSEALRTSTP